jgi:hypothetical protein
MDNAAKLLAGLFGGLYADTLFIVFASAAAALFALCIAALFSGKGFLRSFRNRKTVSGGCKALFSVAALLAVFCFSSEVAAAFMALYAALLLLLYALYRFLGGLSAKRKAALAVSDAAEKSIPVYDSAYELKDVIQNTYTPPADMFGEAEEPEPQGACISDGVFGELLAAIHTKADGAEPAELQALALFISNEKERPGYSEKQKKALGEEIRDILLQITAGDTEYASHS